MRLTLWPQSLFGRLLAASVLAVIVAQAVGLFLIAEERERFVLQWSVREWSRRIAETTLTLQSLSPAERAAELERLSASPPGRHRVPPPPGAHPYLKPGPLLIVPLPWASDVGPALSEQVRSSLGPGYTAEVRPTPAPAPPAIAVSGPFFEAHDGAAGSSRFESYDVSVRVPEGDPLLFRVTRMAHGTLLPQHLFFNLTLLLVILLIALYVVARSITRPLSGLARAADRVGRGAREEPLPERGARELRRAAHAFNTMQDRLRRYFDSRTRVLAAMSHDLKTPLTRLRLQVETLEDPPLQARIGRELDEMEGMVREALALFRGVEDGEAAVPVDLNELLGKVRDEFADMGAKVTVAGRAAQPLRGRPQALKRCLTNLVANAVKFGSRAEVELSDGPVVAIRVRDSGPGIPDAELERVFEPFYRLESSRNRDSGGTGLGLTIARDLAQAHGGTLTLRNRASGGLEAELLLPRAEAS
ncbi:MAG TPA: ATP-binding protein [Steroidobacteraceae bacterium]|nr:ATP-binding protein [Steroidobacteraceae bacterium]